MGEQEQQTNGKAASCLYKSCVPHLVVEGSRGSDAISFYKRAFGAEEVSKTLHKRKAEEEMPLILHAHLKFGSSEIMLCDEVEGSSCLNSDATELLRVLGEMTAGLDEIQSKLMPFLEKVNEREFHTTNGLSYLESKHLLLMFYCECIVFYIILKANGRSVENHPVIARLIEIRLFLEKIRPIDKKLHYQIEKLLKMASGVSNGAGDNEQATVPDDLLYKPNPDLLVSKIDEGNLGKDAIYRPPMIAPTAMDEDRISKNRKSESRAQKDALRKASRSTLLKDLANDLEGRPEEIKEFVGPESKEMTRELSRLEARAQQEENLFARVPLSRVEKKRLKLLKQSRNGLLGMLDDFDDDISYLVDMEENKRGVSSHELDVPISQDDARLRNPKKTTKFKRQKGMPSMKVFGGKKDLKRRKRDT